ncbi:BlaI/MecI/CopY family transcriptional regulator [Xanthomonas citri]
MPISDAEAVVMHVLWEDAPRTAEEVIAALGKL